MSTPTKKRIPSFSTYVTTEVDVDIDPDDLHDAGWHHDSECKDAPPAAVLEGGDAESLGSAVASLHRQAHPSQPRDVALCREEPCRSLTIEQLRQVSL